MVSQNGTNPESTIYGYHTQVASDADATDDIKPKTITKIGSTFYYNKANGEKVVIEGFDPTAASFELAKLSEKDKTTSTTGDRHYTADGEEWYTSKIVTTTTPTYSLTYTKL